MIIKVSFIIIFIFYFKSKQLLDTRTNVSRCTSSQISMAEQEQGYNSTILNNRYISEDRVPELNSIKISQRISSPEQHLSIERVS